MTKTDNNTALGVLRTLIKSPLYWLLLAIPIAVVLEVTHASPTGLFIVSCIAVIPLAGLMGRATENLAETMGSGIGGLLNATFGNAAELIIALIALHKQEFDLVKASITGSIIGNVLLVLGLALFCGGMFHKKLKFNATAAGMGSTLMALAGVGLVIPSLYQFAIPAKLYDEATVVSLSEEIAVILAITYVLSLWFTLKTHSHLSGDMAHEVEHADSSGAEDGEQEHHEPEWNRTTSITLLVLATIGVAVMSEFLIGSASHACDSLGMTKVFVGVIVVAIIGNAAEHSTAVIVAMKNKMDLSVGIAVGSSIQIALFVAPVLVFASVLMGHEHPLDLHFTLLELLAVLISIGILALVCHDGESHWMEGVMLLAVYIMIGLAFYHLPVDAVEAVNSAVHSTGH